MPVINELIRSEKDGTLSFGNYELDTKSKLSDFEHCGDTYKVKTFKEITKLERNGSFVYESVPGTAVMNFKATDTGLSFKVEGSEDAQITVELEEGASYNVTIDGAFVEFKAVTPYIHHIKILLFSKSHKAFAEFNKVVVMMARRYPVHII